MKYSIIYTFFLTLITPFLLFADFEIPAWNQSLPYSANFLVLDENNVTYISLQEVEEGKTLDSTEYWQKLVEVADSFDTPSGLPENEPDIDGIPSKVGSRDDGLNMGDIVSVISSDHW